MRNNDFSAENIRYWLVGGGIPVTKLIIAANILLMLVVGFSSTPDLAKFLMFDSDTVAKLPWTIFTYPLVSLAGGGYGIIGVLFAAYWLWLAGGSLERSWGSTRYAVFFFMMSGITALGLLLGSFLTGVPVQAIGLWLPIAAITVAFGMMNPENVILFMFFIPMKLKFLAVLDVVLVFISFFNFRAPQTFLLAVAALAGCAFSFWYVTSGARFGASYSPSTPRQGQVIHLFGRRGWTSKLNPMHWFREYRERKRLKDFFNKSGFRDH